MCATRERPTVYRTSVIERGQNVHPDMHRAPEVLYKTEPDAEIAAKFDRHVVKDAWKPHQDAYGDDSVHDSKSKMEEWFDENKDAMLAAGLPLEYAPEDDEESPDDSNDNARAGEKRPGEENDNPENAKRRKLEHDMGLAARCHNKVLCASLHALGSILLEGSQKMILLSDEPSTWRVPFLCDNTGEPVVCDPDGNLVDEYESPLWWYKGGTRTMMDETQRMALVLACGTLKHLMDQTEADYTRQKEQDIHELVERTKQEERKTCQLDWNNIQSEKEKQAISDAAEEKERTQQKFDEEKERMQQKFDEEKERMQQKFDEEKERMQQKLDDAVNGKEAIQKTLDETAEKVKELQKTLHDAAYDIKATQQRLQDAHNEKTALHEQLRDVMNECNAVWQERFKPMLDNLVQARNREENGVAE